MSSTLYPLSNKRIAAPSRMALVLSYEGLHYHGWQAQKSGVPSVQAELERALSNVASQPVEVVCAGRTDAGVNATAQVVHFDVQAERSPHAWVMGCNHHLPDDISVLWAGPVNADFHARFSATARTYRYIILNHPVKPSIGRSLVTWVYQYLDTDVMQEASRHLLGEHDFSSFRGSDCQSHTPFRFVSDITVSRNQDLIVVEVKANAFLHHMVRNIVGSLIQVGMGKQSPSWIAQVLASKDRKQAGVTAPPTGLYLVGVDYPQEFGLPCVSKGPFFLSNA